MHLSIPGWYRSPLIQVALVGCTCFCTSGMFVAVTNLGAGGTEDVSLADTANGVLYGCFSIMGLFSGGVTNLLGVRLTLWLGSLGYALYIGSLWCFQTQGTRWFVILSGAVLGISAALLWSAQGSIMMSYPLEKDKGKSLVYPYLASYVSMALFQFGSFIGAVIALAINIQHGGISSVSTGTYLAFLIIVFVGAGSAALLLPPASIVRADGSLVKMQAASSPKEELRSLVELFRDWRMLALAPMFFVSNYAYAYQGAVNAFYFEGSTRAVNATLEGAGAIVGALIVGFGILDAPHVKRRTRGWLGLAFVTVCIVAVWSSALAWQVTFTRASQIGKMSYRSGGYAPKGALYFFYYISDAAYQALAYWIIGAITNDPFKLARYAGFFKAIQSAGSAGSFGMDAVATPFLNELLAIWIMTLVSLPLAGLVIYHIHETSYQNEDTVFVGDVKVAETEKKEETAILEKELPPTEDRV